MERDFLSEVEYIDADLEGIRSAIDLVVQHEGNNEPWSTILVWAHEALDKTVKRLHECVNQEIIEN